MQIFILIRSHHKVHSTAQNLYFSTMCLTISLNVLIFFFQINAKSRKVRKLFEFMHDLTENVDVGKIYGTDKYISALGLSVSPAFRGQKLGIRLLEAR